MEQVTAGGGYRELFIMITAVLRRPREKASYLPCRNQAKASMSSFATQKCARPEAAGTATQRWQELRLFREPRRFLVCKLGGP